MNEGRSLRPQRQAWGLGPFWESHTHSTRHSKAGSRLPSPTDSRSEEGLLKGPKSLPALLRPKGEKLPSALVLPDSLLVPLRGPGPRSTEKPEAPARPQTV